MPPVGRDLVNILSQRIPTKMMKLVEPEQDFPTSAAQSQAKKDRPKNSHLLDSKEGDEPSGSDGWRFSPSSWDWVLSCNEQHHWNIRPPKSLKIRKTMRKRISARNNLDKMKQRQKVFPAKSCVIIFWHPELANCKRSVLIRLWCKETGYIWRGD